MQSNSPTVCHNSSPSPRIALQPTTTKTGSSQQDELCDSSLVKSVSFFEETCPDTSKKSKVDLSQQHPKSSTVNIQPMFVKIQHLHLIHQFLQWDPFQRAKTILHLLSLVQP